MLSGVFYVPRYPFPMSLPLLMAGVVEVGVAVEVLEQIP
jgi:hypothetical protein